MTVATSGWGRVRRVIAPPMMSTELAGLALVAGRVAAVVERAIEGTALTGDDRRQLRAARDQLQRNLKPEGPTRSKTRHVHSSGLIVSAARSVSGTRDAATALRDLAADLESLAEGQHAKNPERLLKYYDNLAARARQQSRGPGETVTRSR